MASLGSEFLVNVATAGDQILEGLSLLSDGRFVITWRSTPSGTPVNAHVFAHIFNSDGSPVDGVSEFVVSDHNAPGLLGTPADLPNGRFIVQWEAGHASSTQGDLIFSQSFGVSGTVVTREALGFDFINTTRATTNITGSVFLVRNSIATLDDGRFFSTWESNDNGSNTFNIRGRAFDAGGNPVANDFVVNSTAGQNFDPVVAALSNNRFVAVWSANAINGETDIRARLFEADGTPVANDFIVNTTLTEDQREPSVAVLSNGRFLVTWTDDAISEISVIRGRLFEPDGNPVGPDFQIAQSFLVSFTPAEIAIAALPDGKFFAAWASGNTGSGSNPAADPDGSGGAIFGRTFNADGTPASDPVIVNITVENQQFGPHAVTLPDGRVLVTYSSRSGDGSGVATLAVLVDLDGPGVNLLGTIDADIITGTQFDDELSGIGGNDTLKGGARQRHARRRHRRRLDGWRSRQRYLLCRERGPDPGVRRHRAGCRPRLCVEWLHAV